MRPQSLCIKALFIMTLLSPRLFAQLNWTWYFSGTVLGTDATGPYIDVTLAVRADSEADEGGIGPFIIEGYMSESLYDFGEEAGGIDYSPVLDTNLLATPDYRNHLNMTFKGISEPYDWQLDTKYGGDPGEGRPIVTGGVDVAVLRYYIKDANGTSGIVFKQADSKTWNDSGDQVGISFDATGGDASLPVQMSLIQARSEPGQGVILEWRTESESGCAGFHVWKSLRENDSYQRLTASLIPGRGGASAPRDYTFTDRNVQQGVIYWYQIEEESTDGRSRFYGPVSVTAARAVPDAFTLTEPYPNPFNPSVAIELHLTADIQASVTIYTLLGQKVRSLTVPAEAGFHRLEWDGKQESGLPAPSGIYLLRVQTAEGTLSRKITLIR